MTKARANLLGSVDPPASNPLAQHLLVDPEDDRGLCHDFLTEAVRRSGDDESIKEVLIGAVDELSRTLVGMTMNDNYKPYILVSSIELYVLLRVELINMGRLSGMLSDILHLSMLSPTCQIFFLQTSPLKILSERHFSDPFFRYPLYRVK